MGSKTFLNPGAMGDPNAQLLGEEYVLGQRALHIFVPGLQRKTDIWLAIDIGCQGIKQITMVKNKEGQWTHAQSWLPLLITKAEPTQTSENREVREMSPFEAAKVNREWRAKKRSGPAPIKENLDRMANEPGEKKIMENLKELDAKYKERRP